MDTVRIAVRLAVLVAVAAFVVVVGYSFLAPDAREDPSLLLAEDGVSPFVLNETEGVQMAIWQRLPVQVFVTTQARLDGVEERRGDGQATPSLGIGDGLRVFALSGKSTHLGCTNGFASHLGASNDIADYDGDGFNDGRILDPCGQSQWDAFNRGKVLPGMPAQRDLPSLRLEFRGNQLYGLGYDGPVGPPR